MRLKGGGFRGWVAGERNEEVEGREGEESGGGCGEGEGMGFWVCLCLFF